MFTSSQRAVAKSPRARNGHAIFHDGWATTFWQSVCDRLMVWPCDICEVGPSFAMIGLSSVGRVDNLYFRLFCRTQPVKMAWSKEKAMELAGAVDNVGMQDDTVERRKALSNMKPSAPSPTCSFRRALIWNCSMRFPPQWVSS